MPAVNRVANPPPRLAKYVKFSIKASIPHKNDLKTAFQTFFLFSAFAKCEKKLEFFVLFRLKVKFLDLPNLDKTIPNAFSKMPQGIKGRFVLTKWTLIYHQKPPPIEGLENLF